MMRSWVVLTIIFLSLLFTASAYSSSSLKIKDLPKEWADIKEGMTVKEVANKLKIAPMEVVENASGDRVEKYYSNIKTTVTQGKKELSNKSETVAIKVIYIGGFVNKVSLENEELPSIDELNNVSKLFMEKKYSETIKASTDILTDRPSLAHIQYMRGMSSIYLRDFESAKKDFTNILEQDPTFLTAIEGMGLAHYFGQDYERAIQEYDKLIKLNPDNPAFYNNRGMAKYRLGDKLAGINDLEYARKLGPQITKSVQDVVNMLEAGPPDPNK